MERVISAAPELGIKILTLYAFSTENWERLWLNRKAPLTRTHSHELLPQYFHENSTRYHLPSSGEMSDRLSRNTPLPFR